MSAPGEELLKIQSPSTTEAKDDHREEKQQNKPTSTASSVVETVDSELDAILDSALEDFDKPPVSKSSAESSVPKLTPEKSAGKDKNEKKDDKSAEQDGVTAEDLNYDTLADVMSKQFEECFSSLLNDPSIKKQFEDLSKSAEEAATSNNPEAFADTVEKALNGMSLNAENLQTEPNQQDMWEELAKSFGTDGGGLPEDLGGLPSMEGLGGLGPMGGMFQNMVQQLLSKELLYQPLKEVAEKYHEYLDANKETLDAETSAKYTKQLDIVERVVSHLDGDSDQHSQEEKNSRFEVLLDLLQQMHVLGNPPKEVVGDSNMMMPNLPDLANLGAFPGMGAGAGGQPDPSQCRLM